MPYKDKAAFRCKTCGHLEGEEHAGENAVPHACSVCGSGVVLNPKANALAQELANPETTPERRAQIPAELIKLARTVETEKLVEPENWEVLHDAEDERLSEIGLTRSQVAKHEGKPVLRGLVRGTQVALGAESFKVMKGE